MLDLFAGRKVLSTNAGVEAFNHSTTGIFDIIYWILSILVWLYALYLAWTCNNGFERIIMLFIAFIIPYFYLIGYFIYHKIFGYPCGDSDF